MLLSSWELVIDKPTSTYKNSLSTWTLNKNYGKYLGHKDSNETDINQIITT